MNADYKEYHPKWYRRRIPIVWWKGNPAYIKFIARELTSVCVAYVAIVLLVQVGLLARGVEAYNGFMSWLRSPIVIVIHIFVLLALLFHTVRALGRILQVGCAREDWRAVHRHPTAAADPHAARPPIGEASIQIVLDVVEGI